MTDTYMPIAHSHANRDSKSMPTSLKKWSYFNKKVLFKLNFQEEGRLDANFIFIIYRKCLHFQFFSRVIRIHIITLIGVKNGRIRAEKIN